jgi:predicted double-glycine peptidase
MANTAVQYDATKYPNFKEFLWYKEHETELVQQYYGRYVVIKDEQIIGEFGSRTLARQQTLKNHKSGTFIIHHCVKQIPRRFPAMLKHKIVTVHEI